jgi:serine/threonine-protein kinase haspin
MDDLEHGVQATIIDLGLSRMDAGDGDDGEDVQWTPFDDEVFMGKGMMTLPYSSILPSLSAYSFHAGDYQFEVYRMMKAHTGGNWEAYHPLTNVMVCCLRILRPYTS